MQFNLKGLFGDFKWGYFDHSLAKKYGLLHRFKFFGSYGRYGRCYGVTDRSNRAVTVGQFGPIFANI